MFLKGPDVAQPPPEPEGKTIGGKSLFVRMISPFPETGTPFPDIEVALPSQLGDFSVPAMAAFAQSQYCPIFRNYFKLTGRTHLLAATLCIRIRYGAPAHIATRSICASCNLFTV